MGINFKAAVNSISRAGLALFLTTFILIIAALQHSSTSYSIHATSGSTCSCGCVEDTGDCGTTCCTTMSVAPCGCNEPHQTVVEFILPTSFDLFFQIEEELEETSIPSFERQNFDDTFYKSLIIETPSPIPIT